MDEAAKWPVRDGPASCVERRLLLRRSDRILHGLGEIELRDGLGRNLDGLAGLGIATNTGLAGRLFQAAEAGQYEHAVLLGFFYGGIRQRLQERSCGLVVHAVLFGEMTHELRLGHACCHEHILLDFTVSMTQLTRILLEPP